MSQPELLKKIIRILGKNNIPYMVTGSIVSSLQGEPRATHDIDIVISIQSGDISGILEAFPMPPYYLSEKSIKEAIQYQRMFNVIDTGEGDKIDFWILSGDAYDQTRFQRRVVEKIFGEDVYISTPEDTILYKLHWAKLSGGSEKQFGDALRVFEVQYSKLDMSYLESWTERLQIVDLWKRLKQQADIIE